MTPTRYTIIVEAGRDPFNREPIIRLRQVLKLMLRGFGFRCLSVTEQKPAPVSTAGPDSQTVG